ncbi:MAG TPA: alpha/beta hydrolase [Steroidobacteraceae bacterium]|nr:alpha/beta hydrolase [Steroidobacteraceae bacterium]
MFEPFPGNYVWNLGVNLALMGAGNIGEIDRACRPIKEAASRGDDAGTAEFFDSWLAVATQLVKNGQADEAARRPLSASAKYGRAAGYFFNAERLQSRDYAPRWEAYANGLKYFKRYVELSGANCEFVEIPYQGVSYPGLFVKAAGKGGKPAPAVVSCNGLDSMKEQIFCSGNAQAMVNRGVSVLLVDQPGTGQALRQRNLVGVYDSERWASEAINYLLTRADVDHDRIGMFGLSLGGYYAPRATAMDPRFKLCALLGANHDWGELQKRRQAREGKNPVPHYWDHVCWVFGKSSVEEFMAFAPKMCLDGVIEKIKVPFLITHGEGDRQIPLEYAHKSYDQAVNSPKRELKIFTANDFEVEHCGADNGTVARDYIADWIAETFGTV